MSLCPYAYLRVSLSGFLTAPDQGSLTTIGELFNVSALDPLLPTFLIATLCLCVLSVVTYYSLALAWEVFWASRRSPSPLDPSAEVVLTSAKYSHPRLALLSSARYPEEKTILDAARASAKNPRPTDLQLGDSLYFTDFKFFGAVAASHILDDPVSMERRALRAHIERGIYDWTWNDFYGSPSEAGVVRYAAAGDARLFQYCMDLDKEGSLSPPIIVWR